MVAYSRSGLSRRRHGFTLLEVLLATVLMSALLMTLWSLVGTYTSLFETGAAKTEQSQIARALLQQICDDLQNAIQDTSASRCFGLAGSRKELRLDILQTVPLEAAIESAQADDDSSAEVSNQFADPQSGDASDRVCRAPELRTVYYSFKRPQNSDGEELSQLEGTDATELEELLLGLVREEIDFETKSWADSLADDGVSRDEAQTQLATRLADGSILWAPEVSGLEFRYFDGETWQSQWDGIKQRVLPVAVEIRLSVDSPDPRDVRRRTAGDSDDESISNDDTAAHTDAETYRLVVALPMAGRSQTSSRPDMPPSASPHRPPSLRVKRLEPTPMALPPKASAQKYRTPRKSSDKWLRNDSQ